MSSLKKRAEKLHQYLDDNFAGQEINLVGHSMGGLDCRYLIAHIPNKDYIVKSLSTVATPHRGSSFMDWCRDNLGVGHIGTLAQREANDAVIAHLESLHHENLIYDSKQYILPKILKPVDAPAFSNLTRDYCAEFNKVTPDDPNIRYFSYAAHTNLKPYQALAFSHYIVNQKEGVNDGLVSVESAKWGEFCGLVDCDHWDLVPPKLRLFADRNRRRFNPDVFYMTIVTRLATMGF